MDLQGKIIIVTGGKGLLGTAIVHHCRDAGAQVYSAEISTKERMDEWSVPLAIGSEESIQQCIETVWKKHGHIDGLVNCAYPRTSDWRLAFEDVPAESFRKNLDMHLTGYILCCRAVLEKMKTQRSGSVINIASIYGVVAPDFSLYEGTSIATSPAAYAAIKGGLLQMTRYLASYYGRYNIRVNAVSPGGIFDSHPPEFERKYSARTLLGRMATPDDIAPGAVYLLSDASSYVTGHNLVIDGGWTAM